MQQRGILLRRRDTTVGSVGITSTEANGTVEATRAIASKAWNRVNSRATTALPVQRRSVSARNRVGWRIEMTGPAARFANGAIMLSLPKYQGDKRSSYNRRNDRGQQLLRGAESMSVESRPSTRFGVRRSRFRPAMPHTELISQIEHSGRREKGTMLRLRARPTVDVGLWIAFEAAMTVTSSQSELQAAVRLSRQHREQ